MKKRLKNVALILFAAVVSFVLILASCAGKKKMSVYDAEGKLVFDSETKSITLEYAETYSLPINVQINGKKVKLDSVKLYDAEANECKLSYGSYQFMKVGDYEVRYSAESLQESYTIKCIDSTYPEISVHAATLYGIVGERVTLPNFTATDSAGIDQTSEKLRVSAPDGKEVAIDTDRSFLIEKPGDYAVTYSVADNNGNVSEKTISITGFAKYIDENRKDLVIYTFDNADYLNLTVDVPNRISAQREIVNSGYPAVENEAEGNKVLKITSAATFDDVYTCFLLHENLLASTGQKIVVRLAVSADTDYVKIFRNRSSLDDKGLVAQQFGVKANTWYNLEINPIAYGYNVPFEDFVVMFRDKGETALYIDEIYFEPIAFSDTSRADGVVADFDEPGYLANVYQNIYGDPTTTRNWRVDGSTFSIVSGEDLPRSNDADAHTPFLAPSGGALKVETQFNRGGVTFMFPEPIDLNEIISLNFRIYVKKNPNVVVIGFFNGVGYDGGNNTWIDPDSEYYDYEWNNLSFTAEYLKTYTSNDKIGGFYLYTNARTYPAEIGHVIYIDEIFTVKRNTESEQKGKTIASFSSEASLANVTQNGGLNASEFTYSEEKFGENGILSVVPSKSASGARFFFDNTFKPTVNDAILLNLATESTAAKTLDVCVSDGNMEKFLGRFDLEAHAGVFKRIAIAGKDILNAGITDLRYLRFDITVSSVGKQAALYIDEISLYDDSADDDLPEIVSKTNAVYSGLEGSLSVDISSLDIQVKDESDPTAEWFIIALKDPNGVDITREIANDKFSPRESGEYKLSVKAKDLAGNVSSEETVITIAVTIYTQKLEYYKAAWQLNDLSALQIVTGAEVRREDLGNENYAISGLIKHDDFAPIGRQDLTIDMGGIYRVKEIESIAIRYRYLNDAKAADGTYISMNLNANGDKVEKNRLTGLEYKGENSGWYIAKKTENFATLTIPQSSLKANLLGGTLLSADDFLTSLSFSTPSWRPSGEASGCRVRMQIDSIEVKLVPQFKEEYLEFNTADSLDIVSGMDAKFVELENGKKAVQATFKNDALNDPNTTADDEAGTKVNFRINLGGIYKVAEIESIEISYKIISGDGALWWRVNLNDIYDDNRRVTGVDYSSKTTSNGTPTAQFETIRISNERLKTNTIGGSILSDEDYLTSLSFSNASYQTDLKFRCTMQIEYIRITLKGK